MKVVFMGTPEFAVPSLSVCYRDHDLVAVVTQPDKAKNRGQKMGHSPIKEFALEHNLPIFQPQRASEKEFQATVAQMEPDILVVVAFGQKIPSSLLRLAPHGCINVHGSLLPQYRGSSPIHRAIADGRATTGVTTMYLSEDWDAGDVILQRPLTISRNDTAGSVHDRMMLLGADLLAETLRQIETGTAPRVAQNHSQATYAFKLTKDDGQIDWTQSADKIGCLIRGMTPWPGAYTLYDGKRIKIRRATVQVGEGTPGQILDINEWGIVVGTGENLLRVEELQQPGAKWLPGRDAANGMHLQAGEEFR